MGIYFRHVVMSLRLHNFLTLEYVCRSNSASTAPLVTFWESLTGSRYSHDGALSISSAKYGRVGCVFNHEGLYANVQENDSVSACLFDLSNSVSIPLHIRACAFVDRKTTLPNTLHHVT